MLVASAVRRRTPGRRSLGTPVRCSSCLLRSPRRCGAHRACCRLPEGTPVPRGSSGAADRCRSPGNRSFPTQSVVQGFIEITTSSSSSHVWKLGIGPLRAAQRPNGPVGRCGWSASSCCRHVDNSTAVHRGRRPSTPCPLSRPRSVPRRVPRSVAAGRRRCRGLGRDGRAAIRAGQRAVTAGRRSKRAAIRAPAAGQVTGRDPASTRDLPNLCTFLGTTSRRVDHGHRPRHRPQATATASHGVDTRLSDAVATRSPRQRASGRGTPCGTADRWSTAGRGS